MTTMEGTTVSDFARLLNEAATLLGMSAKEIGARAGYHRVTVASWQRNLTPSDEAREAVVRALKVALAERAAAIEKLRKKLGGVNRRSTLGT